MKIFLFLAILFLSTSTYSSAEIQYLTSAQQQQSLTPLEVLHQLKQGNDRFFSHQLRNYDYPAITRKSATAQYPTAIILSCIDSRSVPDIVFDQGLGNIFVSRVAGNVVDKDILASMEYAVVHAGAKLIVVMGHTNCGAVTSACVGLRTGEGNLHSLLNKINPAVQKIKPLDKKASCENNDILNKIVKQNVINQLNTIYRDSSKLRQLATMQRVLLIGAMHNLADGKVTFFDQDAKNIEPV